MHAGARVPPAPIHLYQRDGQHPAPSPASTALTDSPFCWGSALHHRTPGWQWDGPVSSVRPIHGTTCSPPVTMVPSMGTLPGVHHSQPSRTVEFSPAPSLEQASGFQRQRCYLKPLLFTSLTPAATSCCRSMRAHPGPASQRKAANEERAQSRLSLS